MEHAEAGEHGLGAQPQSGRLTRVELRPGLSHDLQVVDWRTGLGQQGQGLGLGVEGIEGLGLARCPAAYGALACQHHAQRQALVARPLGAAQIAAADLEQPQRSCAAIKIAPRGREQSGQQRGAHRLHVLADRVVEHPQRRFPLILSLSKDKGLRLAHRQEGPGHGLVQPARGGSAADAAFQLLRRGRGRPGHAIGARQGDGLDVVEPPDPDNLLDQVGHADHVGAPAGRGDGPVLAHTEAQRFQNATLLSGGDRHPAQGLGQRGVISHHGGVARRGAGADHVRCFAPAGLEDQPGEQLQPRIEEQRIDPALEPAARVGGEVERAARRPDPLGIEIGHLQQHVGGRVRTARMLAAHDPGDVVHPGRVGDHGHLGGEGIGLAIERQAGLALARTAGDDRAGELREVIGMGRAPEAQHHVVGQIDQRRDRALPRALQPVLQPLRRGAVGHALDDAAMEGRAAFGIFGADLGGTGEGAVRRQHGNRLQRPKPRRRQIAGDAVDAHAVGPVGGDRHVEHRIGAMVFGEGCADRGVRGQFDDPVVILAQLQLASRAHHPVGFDPTHRGNLQHHAVHRHGRARQAEHADQTGAGIGRAADHLQRIAFPGVDGQHLQLVGIGVRRGGEHPGDAEAGQLRGGILDPLHFQPDGVQRGGDLGNGSLGIEVVLEPGERELHETLLLTPECRRRPTGSARRARRNRSAPASAGRRRRRRADRPCRT